MELLFENKEKREIILNKSQNILPIVIDEHKSYLFEGDNFDIMSGILNYKKGFIDLIYIDPPFNTNQIFSVSQERSNTISREKNSTVAYQDLMSDDNFLKFMYERFILMYELLSDKGSIYVHIDTKMGHYLKIILDEIFGTKNFKNDISRIKSNPKNFSRKAYGNEKDMILFYSKDSKKNIWNEVKIPLEQDEIENKFSKIDNDGRRYTTIPLHAPGETNNGITGMPWRGMLPPTGRHWRTNPDEFEKLDELGRIEWSKTGNPRIKKYADEHLGKKIQDIWEYKDPQMPIYPTQKNLKMLELIILQSSEKNSIIMDCFSGSGTTLLAAAKHGRNFIGIDSSKIAIEKSSLRLIESNIEFKKI